MNLKKRLKPSLFLILIILSLLTAVVISEVQTDSHDYWTRFGLCSRNRGRLYSGISWHIREYGIFPNKDELAGLIKWPGAEKYVSWCPLTKVDYVYNHPEVTSQDNFIVFYCPVHTHIKIKKEDFNRVICDRNLESLAYGIHDYVKENSKFPIQMKEIPEESEFGRRTYYCPLTKVNYVYNQPKDTSPDNFVVLSCPVHTPMYDIKIEKGLIDKLGIEK